MNDIRVEKSTLIIYAHQETSFPAEDNRCCGRRDPRPLMSAQEESREGFRYPAGSAPRSVVSDTSAGSLCHLAGRERKQETTVFEQGNLKRRPFYV